MQGNQRTRRLVFGTVLVLCGVLVLVLALRPSEQARIGQTVRAMARLCEARDTGGLAGHLAPGYRGTIGSTRDEAIESMRRALEDVDSLTISVLNIETEINGGRAGAMIVFQSEGSVILADTKSRLPFKNMTAVSGQDAEMVFAEFIKTGDRWLLEHVTFDVRAKLPRFPRTVAFLARQ